MGQAYTSGIHHRHYNWLYNWDALEIEINVSSIIYQNIGCF